MRSTFHRTSWLRVALVLSGLASNVRAESQSKPWRLDEVTGLAPTLSLGLEQRTRVERLHPLPADPRERLGLFARTLLNAELRLSPVFVRFEGIDARLLVSPGTGVSNQNGDALDVLQLHAGLRAKDLFTTGDTATIALGRVTLDLGSRRLLARNEFRNTINAFTGLDLQWRDAAKRHLRLLTVVPVVRLPGDRARVGMNDVIADAENFDALTWAAFSSFALDEHTMLETYLIGHFERDSGLLQTTDRRLVTAGARWMRPPAIGTVDFQLEAMVQWGTSRASDARSDRTDLAHAAASLHASTGYVFDHAWRPRVVAQYDFASGDGDRSDGRNNAFDPLFGARRFEFGPTGLYGVLGRRDTHSPGIRLEFAPDAPFDGFVAHRFAWFDSTAGDWPFVAEAFRGRQWEGRLRWHALPGNVSIEVGGAIFLPRGEAPTFNDQRPEAVTFGYAQLTGTI